VGCGNPGLAGASGPKDDHLWAGTQGIEIIRLRWVERLDRRKNAFVFELLTLEFYDFSSFDSTRISPSLLVTGVLTQGLTPFAVSRGIVMSTLA
jgi:hypothetical protein